MKKSNTELIIPHFENNGKVNLPSGTYLKAVTNLNNDRYKDQFAFLFSKAYSQLMLLHTITAYKTYFTLVLLVIERKTVTLDVTQKVLAEILNCAGAEISKAMAELERVELVLRHTRGCIHVNPKYIWYGSLISWQNAMESREKEDD